MDNIRESKKYKIMILVYMLVSMCVQTLSVTGIPKVHRRCCRGYDTQAISVHRLVSLLGGPTSRSLATMAHLSQAELEPHTKASGRPRPLPSPSTACFATPHDLSFVSTPRGSGGRSTCTKCASPDKGRHAPLTLLGLRGQLSSQSG
jgi:hypothetical protein